MDFELGRAMAKLRSEHRKQIDRARAAAERDRHAKEAAVRRHAAMETEQRARRLNTSRDRAEVEQQKEATWMRDAAEPMRRRGAVAAVQRIDTAHVQPEVDCEGNVFFGTFEPVRYDGNGDKIKLPPSCFSELMSAQGALDKGPMHFVLSRVIEAGQPDSGANAVCEDDTVTTHCGVLEFTAREGFAELTPHVWNNLFRHSSPTSIKVQYVDLPKGTYAKLKPEAMGFFDLPNHKAVLETALRTHATLSQGDILVVSFGELKYKLKVLELKPASSVSVLETDIEVAFEQSDSAMDIESNQHVLIPLAVGKAESGIVEEGMFKYYKFSIEGILGEKVASGNANIEVKIEAGASSGDTDVYASRHPLIFPNQHRHEWSSHEIGSKVLMLKPKDPSLIAGTYSIGVFGFKGTEKYQISVDIKQVDNRRTGMHASIPSPVDLDSVQCSNCKRHVPSHSRLLHEAYCNRHNVACPHDGCGVILQKNEAENHVHCSKCGLAFQRAELEKHMIVFHAPLHCPCGLTLEKDDMVQHQSTACPLRLIVCRFCGDMVQAGREPVDARDRIRGFSEHESVCGSRTAPCDTCGRYVMLKDMDMHATAVHQNSEELITTTNAQNQ